MTSGRVFASALVVIGMSATRPASADGISKDECITANEDAQVAQRDAHLLHAREELRLCVATSCPDAVRVDCVDQLKAVDAAIPSVIVDAADTAGHVVDVVSVSIDGAAAIPLASSRTIELDPGTHTLAFTRQTSTQIVRTSVTVQEGERGRHIGVSFTAGSSNDSSSQPHERSDRNVDSAGHQTPIAALILGGAGVLSVGIGTVFWRSAVSNNDASYGGGHCDATGCDLTGKGLRNDALNDATIATVTMVLGLGAVVAGGVILYVKAPATPGAGTSRIGLRPLVGAGGGGVALTGAW